MPDNDKTDPRVLKQHNNVPGAINGRRQLAADKRQYFTSSKELANLIVNRENCTIIEKVDCLVNSVEWQYLLYIGTPDNEIVIAKAPSNYTDYKNCIYFKVVISGIVNIDGFALSPPATDREIYLVLGKGEFRAWKGLWSYEKPVDFNAYDSKNKVVGTRSDKFVSHFRDGAYIGCYKGRKYFTTVKLMYFIISKTSLLTDSSWVDIP